MAVSALQITVRGQVQGVGFRPFVFNLAQRCELLGSVANGPQGVSITAQGESAQLEKFVALIEREQPAMACIETMDSQEISPLADLSDFRIIASEQGEVDLGVTPDAAVCHACLEELFEPDNHRYLYPFINCTHCGPRYSLITALPYDRPNTTMAEFTQCSSCLAEYSSADDRRFHAQPNACSECGPQLSFHNATGKHLDDCDPLTEAFQLIQQGKIVALKGVGGFHLVCDGKNAHAIQRLRQLKQRDQKPLALMAANTASLAPFVVLNHAREQRLSAMDAPICLCPKGDSPLPEELAPDQAWLGVMLPHAPLHYLLFHLAAGQPNGTQWLNEYQDLILVMTSANRSGNPQVIKNTDALQQLQGIADGFLLHNREIYTRCDDSVVSMVAEHSSALVRRGRGLSPQYIALPFASDERLPLVLAVGAFFKNALCITKGNRAYVSQYIGDLDSAECCRQLNQTAQQLCQMLDIKPDLVVADLHPEFYSTTFAHRYAQQQKIPLIQVQHHHAHLAAVVAEHKLSLPALGLALDGLGLGDDGNLWGGELFQLDEGSYQRLASFSPVPLPGGDRAAKEPWRVAAGVLQQLGLSDQIVARFPEQQGAEMVTQLLQKQVNSPLTSSAGRMFDAAAALLGLKETNAYEAQAAMVLESQAFAYLRANPWPEEPLLIEVSTTHLNLLPLFSYLLDCEDQGYGAAVFHQQLIAALAQWLSCWAKKMQLNQVVLAGGCFLNQLLVEGVTEQLEALNLQVLRSEKLPCNDGSIALGQAQIALERARLAQYNKNNERSMLCV